MRATTVILAATLFTVSLPCASMAQSSWTNDTVSKLFNLNTAPYTTHQDVEKWRRNRRPVRYEALRRDHRTRRIATGNNRTIRAKAKVTILDRDHIVIELTRPNSGANEGPIASSR